MNPPQSKKLTKLERKIAHLEQIVEGHNQPLTEERVREAMALCGLDPKDAMTMSEIQTGVEEILRVIKPNAEQRLKKLKAQREYRIGKLTEMGPKTG